MSRDRAVDVSGQFGDHRSDLKVSDWDVNATPSNRLLPPTDEVETTSSAIDQAVHVLSPITQFGEKWGNAPVEENDSPLTADPFVLTALTVATKAAGTGASGITITDTPGTYHDGLFTVSRVQASSATLSSTQGWIIARVRMGWGSGSPPAAHNYFFFIGQNGSPFNDFQLEYRTASSTLRFTQEVPTATAVDTAASFSAGDTVTVAAAWTATSMANSFNGSAFVPTTRTAVPNWSAFSTFDIGSTGGVFSGTPVESTYLWFAHGQGRLSSLDVARANRWGDSPVDAQSFPPDWQTKFLWMASTTNSLQKAS